jgi:predicted dehydrogenase
MKVIIIGAGRMGVRHAKGILNSKLVSNITIVDTKEKALDNAKNNLVSSKLNFLLIDKLKVQKNKFDIAILATTANERFKLLKLVNNLGCKNILIEKPIEQSYQKVIQINKYVLKHNLNVNVNLNMRLNKSFLKIKNDIENLIQFDGELNITINTGSIGISANGIHYIDFLLFLLNADHYKIVNAEVYDDLIPSGRGEEFKDFGGWVLIKFFKKNIHISTTFISINSKSTVFGSWEIVGRHARISFNEVDEIYTYSIRKKDSNSPVNLYNKDYLKTKYNKLDSPFLGFYTKKWIESVFTKKVLLPKINETLLSHKIMFEWLSYSKKFKTIYPIT